MGQLRRSFFIGSMGLVLIGAFGSIYFWKESSGLERDGAALRQQVSQLHAENETLQRDNQSLRTTDEGYFQRGVDAQTQSKLEEAKGLFGEVISKFPASSLVEHAQHRLAEVNVLLAKQAEEARSREERGRLEREKEIAEQGAPIEYSELYAQAATSGLPIGKRYAFEADVFEDLVMFPPGHEGVDKELDARPDFDNQAQYRLFLATTHKAFTRCRVVASMGEGRHVLVHKLVCD